MSYLLTRNKTAAEVVETSRYDGVFFIPNGGTPPNPAELLAGASARRVIAELENGSDVLLIACTPTLGLEIGRAYCRARVCQYVSISMDDGSFTNHTTKNQ